MKISCNIWIFVSLILMVLKLTGAIDITWLTVCIPVIIYVCLEITVAIGIEIYKRM